MARFDKEMAEGRVAATFVTGMKGAEMEPPIFNLMPRALAERLVTIAMKGEDKAGSDGYIPMRQIAPTLRHDFQLVVECRSARKSGTGGAGTAAVGRLT